MASGQWQVEVTDEFKRWWDELNEDEQIQVAIVVSLLEEEGPGLPFPYSSRVTSSRYSAMRESRIQHQGRPYRVLYIFDPRRVAILLLGGNKTGDDRWYEKSVPTADRIYDEHLKEIGKEHHGQDDKVQ